MTAEAFHAYNTFPAGDDLLRLHLNEGFNGSPPGAMATVHQEYDARSGVYPDSDCRELRDRVAEYFGVTPDMVAVGNGVDELVLLSALAYATPDAPVVVTDSTFPGYRTAAAVAGAPVRAVPLVDHRVSPDAVEAAIADGAGPAYVCNPVNPTGTVLDAAGLDRTITAAENAGTIVVFDEAYMDFAEPDHTGAIPAVRAGRRAVVLRTFSKAWGLASLRVGFAVGPADLIAELWRIRQSLPFSVNRLAQKAAAAALGEPEFLDHVREATARERDRLCRGLDRLGVAYVPSVTNFVLARVGGDSADVAGRLADEHGVLVRDLTPFGLAGCLRVTVGSADQVDRFCAALEKVLEDGVPAPPHWARDVPTLAPTTPAELFNGYVGAHVVFALHELGVLERLSAGPAPVAELAETAGARPRALRALLGTAALLGLAELDAGTAALTPAGHAVVGVQGYFTWGVGGYGGFLRALPDLARGTTRPGDAGIRDSARIAMGSGEADRAMLQPVEAEILDGVPFTTVADLGCGDATRLIRLCAADEERRGVGIDVSPQACELAGRRAAEAGVGDRIDIVCGDVLSVGDRVPANVDLVTCFLMLHDLFAIAGGPAEAMRALRRCFPHARHFLIGDTLAQAWDRGDGPLPPFSLEFELVHTFMDAAILPEETYKRAFASAGMRLVRCEPTGIPSTRLYLLAAG